MRFFSTMEVEELGKALGGIMRDQYAFIKDEKTMKSLIDSTVRDLLSKSLNRKAPWGNALAPMDIFNIEKRLYSPAGTDEISKQLQDWNDDVYLLCKMLNTTPGNLKSYKMFEQRWGTLRKALNTATAGEGMDWVPEGFSNQLITMVELSAVVASKFRSFQMPTNPYTYPLLLGDGEAYLGGEPTNNNPAMYKASDPETDNLTFTAKKLIARYIVTDEMEEDSIVPVMPMLRESIARAMAKAEDNSIINGDTSAAHMDTGAPAGDDDARRAWPGLRKLCMASLKQSGSTWAGSTGLGIHRGIREDMEVYGLSSADLKILANTNMINKFKSVNEFLTMDKIGSAATIVNGEITKFDGVDIIPTQHVGEMQNASGIYDGVTTTTTQYLMVYMPGFWRGIRKDFTVELVREPLKGITSLVATTRRVWKAVYDTATKPMVGWVYNVSK